MSRYVLSGLVLGYLMSTVLISCDDLPPPPEALEKLGARVELAAGDVRLVQKSQNTRIITGALLEENAELQIDKGARALIRLGSGAGIFIRENSKIQLKDDTLILQKGELWADFPAGKSETLSHIVAGDVTITAEDAGANISFEKDRISIYSARGGVLASGLKGRAEIQSGEMAVFVKNESPKVESVSFWEDWTGGLADRGTFAGNFGRGAGTLLGIDRNRPGAPPEALQISGQNVTVTIKNGIAHTTVSQRFFNPSSTPLEGYYWFTVPEGATVYRFAMEVNGEIINGEIVERKQAAQAYEEAVVRSFDPALLEWVDGRSYRARIFPIPAAGERQVILSYFETLPLADGAYRYVYPLSAGNSTIQEFSLIVDLLDQGNDYIIKTREDAKIEADRSRVSMRRSGFRPRSDFLLELVPKTPKEPIQALRYSGSKNEADYVMLRITPEADWQKLEKIKGDVVLVADTSAGGDNSDRLIRQEAAEAILRALSEEDRFAIVVADLFPKIIYPDKGMASATETNVSSAMERLSKIPSAGATDLGSMFSSALELLHEAEQPAVVYIGDGNATVGETSSEALSDRLRRSLGESRARLFTIAVGEDADISLLERLALIGGGRSFVISNPEQTVQEALRFAGMLKTPTLTDLRVDVGKGMDQVFLNTAGKVSEGDEIIMLARTHHSLPNEIKLSGKLGSIPFEKSYKLKEERSDKFGFISILWAGQFLGDLMRSGLEENRGRIISLGLSYSLMTPYTSFLVLENNDAYYQQGIQRRNRDHFSSLFKETDETKYLALNLLSAPFGILGCTAERSPEPDAVHAVQVEVSPVSPKAPPSGAEMPHKAAPVLDEARLSDGQMGERSSGAGAAMPAAAAGEKNKREEGVTKIESNENDPRMARSMAQSVIAKNNESVTSDKLFNKTVCSDASGRSLVERRMLWDRRLSMAENVSGYFKVFTDAGRACELPSWRDRKALLDLIDYKVRKSDDVPILLQSFSSIPSAEGYLRNRILRRAFDPDQLLGDVPGEVHWPAFKLGVSTTTSLVEKEKKLLSLLETHPNHVQAREMLVEVYLEQQRKEDALREANRMRRDGTATPKLIELLCDLKAQSDDQIEARRICSELVEFNAHDAEAHRRLGDMFLRHKWYDAAYRQYSGLVAMLKDSPSAMLRMAAAAAGMGKTDEALRIERKVASGDGETGPNDPRRIASLSSAAKLALLLSQERKTTKEESLAIERNLKRTQVFSHSAVWVFLIWEDYQIPLDIIIEQNSLPIKAQETITSFDTGLIAADIGRADPDNLIFVVAKQNCKKSRSVPYKIVTVAFEESAFKIRTSEGEATTCR